MQPKVANRFDNIANVSGVVKQKRLGCASLSRPSADLKRFGERGRAACSENRRTVPCTLHLQARPKSAVRSDSNFYLKWRAENRAKTMRR